MQLIRGIETSHARQAIVASIALLARHLDIVVIAEGIESGTELQILRATGINLFQGFYFAKPLVGRLPVLDVALAA